MIDSGGYITAPSPCVQHPIINSKNNIKRKFLIQLVHYVDELTIDNHVRDDCIDKLKNISECFICNIQLKYRIVLRERMFCN